MTVPTNQLGLRLPPEFWNASQVVVAVSGGSDSMALLCSLLRQRQAKSVTQAVPGVVAFHFDHCWQEKSAEVARWVESKLQALGVSTVIRRRVGAEESTTRNEALGGVCGLGPQSEGDARTQRYAALANVAESLGATYALTGHTADDQTETVLMRIARGTGLSGLAGIPYQRRLSDSCQLLRPLLSESRQRLRDYLQEIEQDFWDDPSNAVSHWTRNRVRHTVLPCLRQHLSPQIDDSLRRLGQLASEHHEMVRCLAEVNRSAILECRDQHLLVDVRALSRLPESVVRTLLVHWWSQARFPQQEMDFEHWSRLASLVCRPVDSGAQPRWPSECHFPGPIVAKRSAGVLRIVTQLK